jgi:hypothetical protein
MFLLYKGPMARELKDLPSAEERQKLREKAGQVLADARALREQLEQVEQRLGWTLQFESKGSRFRRKNESIPSSNGWELNRDSGEWLLS